VLYPLSYGGLPEKAPHRRPWHCAIVVPLAHTRAGRPRPDSPDSRHQAWRWSSGMALPAMALPALALLALARWHNLAPHVDR